MKHIHIDDETHLELVRELDIRSTPTTIFINKDGIEVGRAADFVFMDRAQETAGRTLLESVQLGAIPGIGMVMIDGLVRCTRSRNTPPATQVPVVV